MNSNSNLNFKHYGIIGLLGCFLFLLTLWICNPDLIYKDFFVMETSNKTLEEKKRIIQLSHEFKGENGRYNDTAVALQLTEEFESNFSRQCVNFWRKRFDETGKRFFFFKKVI